MLRERRWVAWVCYSAFIFLPHLGLNEAALAALVVGMAFHWRFWRVAVPMGLVCFLVGWHIGSNGDGA